jgi:hypothetical protein
METTGTIHKDAWIKDVDSKLSGVSYPMDRTVADQKLSGLKIDGEDVTKSLEKMVWPVSNHDDFVSKFRQAKASGTAESKSNVSTIAHSS